MADLPISINASRLIALGYCFSVLEECIIMGEWRALPKIHLFSFLFYDYRVKKIYEIVFCFYF